MECLCNHNAILAYKILNGKCGLAVFYMGTVCFRSVLTGQSNLAVLFGFKYNIFAHMHVIANHCYSLYMTTECVWF